MAATAIGEIQRQIEQLEKQAKTLRQEVAKIHSDAPDDLLGYLGEPLSFQQLMTRSGARADDLRERLTRLYVSGKVERWDLPRFVRSDLGTNEKKALLRQILTETPVRQKGGEALTGLTRGQVSGVLIELQKEGTIERLGTKKGDPWFVARGTQEIEQPPGVAAPPPPGDPTPSTEYRQRRSRRESMPGARSKPRARRPSKGP